MHTFRYNNQNLKLVNFMAPQSKKTNTKSSSSKKKTTTRKTPVKKRTRKKTSKNSNFKKNIFVLLGVFLMISLVAFGYFLGQNDKDTGIKPVKKTESVKVVKNNKPIKQKSKKVSTNSIKELIKDHPSQIEIRRKAEEKKAQEKSLLSAVASESSPEVILAHRGKKPKLVIIIDDVSSKKQLKDIMSLPIKVTPSIFPPYELSKSNHKLAHGLKHYMVHLPMQSGKAYDKQYGTLKITDNKEKMEARVKEIRKLFPTARYINNHTGSVFTHNYKAMEILYGILRKEGFVFVDSRTTVSTKVRKIAHAFGDAYVARDIFIDNNHNVPYIRKQLRQAVKIAKKKGYAIAIGHPHPVTMKALSSAKDIFRDVELVYIDEIYKKKK